MIDKRLILLETVLFHLSAMDNGGARLSDLEASATYEVPHIGGGESCSGEDSEAGRNTLTRICSRQRAHSK
jgi:hypothetical protein